MTARFTVSSKTVWVGRIVSIVSVVFMVFDSVIHLFKPAPVVEAFAQLGYPIGLSVALGMIELVCLAAYVVPLTSVLGAILLTGYLGGAVGAQLRVGNPLFSQALFPIYVGILLWAGIFLRDERLRSLVPLRH